MKCIEIREYGAPEVLVPAERATPVAGAGEVLIRVSASGVNRPDVLQRTGHYPVPPGASDLPGLEVAGVIESGDAAAMVNALHWEGTNMAIIAGKSRVVGSDAARIERQVRLAAVEADADAVLRAGVAPVREIHRRRIE